MNILVGSNGIVVFSAHSFAFGAWEERDTQNGVVVHKWKAEDADGNTLMYLIDENMGAIDGTEQPVFTVHEVDEVPEGAEQGKVLFVDGAFVVNPDYAEPPLPTEERLDYAEENIDNLEEYSADLLYQVCLLQLGLTEEDI